MATKTLQEVRQLCEGDRFAAGNGAVIDSIGDHTAVCSLTITDAHRNAMGAVMGGVSLHADISFLGAAKGEKLIARAVCLKDGKRTACYRVDVTDDLDNLTAAVTITGCHVG